jgi:hypothetical protein
MCRSWKKKLNEIYFFSFGQSMKNIIMGWVLLYATKDDVR